MLVDLCAGRPRRRLVAPTPRTARLARPLDAGQVRRRRERTRPSSWASKKYAFLPEVTGARQNADDWYRYFCEGPLDPPHRPAVQLLNDQQATLEGMTSAATAAASAVKPGGKLWFVFIGHGAQSFEGKGSVLIGYDVQANPDSLRSRSLLRSVLTKLLKAAPSAKQIVIVDSCFGGRAANGEALIKGAQLAMIEGPIEARERPLFSARGARMSSRAPCSACSDLPSRLPPARRDARLG